MGDLFHVMSDLYKKLNAYLSRDRTATTSEPHSYYIDGEWNMSYNTLTAVLVEAERLLRTTGQIAVVIVEEDSGIPYAVAHKTPDIDGPYMHVKYWEK